MRYSRLRLGIGTAVLLSGAALASHFVISSHLESLNDPASIRRHGSDLALHRPAPTGGAALGSLGTSKVSFIDIAQKAGLHYRWTIPGPRPLDILQSIGNGCAFLDYNDDGDLDILLIGPKLALYRGDGHGHFTDVTRQTGLDRFHGHFLGCAVGDYDNDGFEDIYISGYRTGLLLHNDGGRRFTDVTRQAGLAPQPWGTTCAWGDIDGDGRLDLYIGNYIQFDPKTSKRLCYDGTLEGICGPGIYSPEYGVLYHNQSGGKFQDVTAKWRAKGTGKTLGAAFADYDATGRQSLYLANDRMLGNLLNNRGRQFVDVGLQSGVAYDAYGNIHSGMGMDWGDYDNDGRLDMVVTAFQGEPKDVLHNGGNGVFGNVSDATTLTNHTLPYVAFGVKWLDYDNDGWLDLMITNGAVRSNIHAEDPSETYRQPTQLFRNDHGRIFVDVNPLAGPDLTRPIVGRGLAVGDYDNDGRMDALVVDSEGFPLLLHNASVSPGHWLSLKLMGTKSNRDGIGARITVTTDGMTQTRVCHTDGSYLSASDVRVHVGLGHSTEVRTLRVLWPSGHTDTYSHITADQSLLIRESAEKPLIVQSSAHRTALSPIIDNF